jgi:hypothetical protein
MKRIATLKWLTAAAIVLLGAQSLSAQNKADIFGSTVPITWLGLDFSQTKFIGTATQFESAGQISNAQLKDIYTVAWNQLFINEEKKYNVAAAVHRSFVKYDIDVTLKINQGLTQKDFFSNNPGDFKTITEATIADLVKNYDFKNDDGIGLIFFVEGISKGLDSMGIWVTFVDMKSKTVLLTNYQTAKPGGFGFRNYWAKPYYTVLKNMESQFNVWK